MDGAAAPTEQAGGGPAHAGALNTARAPPPLEDSPAMPEGRRRHSRMTGATHLTPTLLYQGGRSESSGPLSHRASGNIRDDRRDGLNSSMTRLVSAARTGATREENDGSLTLSRTSRFGADQRLPTAVFVQTEPASPIVCLTRHDMGRVKPLTGSVAKLGRLRTGSFERAPKRASGVVPDHLAHPAGDTAKPPAGGLRRWWVISG